jgi:hypothetical protein
MAARPARTRNATPSSMAEDDWKAECRDIAAQRQRLKVLRPVPLPPIPEPVTVLTAANRAEDGGKDAEVITSSARSARARMAPAGG